MMVGELEKVSLALYKIAKVEAVINDVSVWDSMGPDGINNVHILHEAMSELAHVISNHVDRGIKLKHETES